MGYKYDICYKKGNENVAVDALSWIHSGELLELAISNILSELLYEIQKSWELNLHLKVFISQL